MLYLNMTYEDGSFSISKADELITDLLNVMSSMKVSIRLDMDTGDEYTVWRFDWKETNRQTLETLFSIHYDITF